MRREETALKLVAKVFFRGGPPRLEKTQWSKQTKLAKNDRGTNLGNFRLDKKRKRDNDREKFFFSLCSHGLREERRREEEVSILAKIPFLARQLRRRRHCVIRLPAEGGKKEEASRINYHNKNKAGRRGRKGISFSPKSWLWELLLLPWIT